jgi:hypothetical protein
MISPETSDQLQAISSELDALLKEEQELDQIILNLSDELDSMAKDPIYDRFAFLTHQDI